MKLRQVIYKSVTILLFIVLNNFLFSQNIQYFDNEWKLVKKKTKASFYRIITKKDTIYSINDYYKNGSIQFKGYSKTAIDPLINEGINTWYYDNGNKSEVLIFKNNKLNGKCIFYYFNGNIFKKVHYKDDKKDGVYKEYFPFGGIAGSANYTSDQLNGRLTEFELTGNVKHFLTYKNGTIDGQYTYFSKNRKNEYKGFAKNGKLDSLCVTIKNDFIYESKFFKEGFLDKTYYMLNLEKDTIIKGIFHKGICERFYFKKERMLNRSKFYANMILKNGVEHWRVYRDSILIIEAYYKEGVKSNIWKIYTARGDSLFELRDYSNANCAERHLQETAIQFAPNFRLTTRFRNPISIIDDYYCEEVKIESFTDDSLHPVYSLEKIVDEEVEDPPIQKKLIVEVESKKNKNSIQKTEKDGIVFYLVKSKRKKFIDRKKKKTKLKDNEIYLFHYVNLKRKKEFFSIKISRTIRQGLIYNKIDIYETVNVFNTVLNSESNFSGPSLYSIRPLS